MENHRKIEGFWTGKSSCVKNNERVARFGTVSGIRGLSGAAFPTASQDVLIKAGAQRAPKVVAGIRDLRKVVSAAL